MKILVLNSHKNINLRMLERHLAVLETTDVVAWNSQIKSAFDAFDEAKPDVVLFDASMKDFLKKVASQYPSVRLVCEDNSATDINDYDLTFTTIVNRKFENKKYIPIYFDMISYINQVKDKNIYQTDVCINQNLLVPPNQMQYMQLFAPLLDIRVNGKIRSYGQGSGGEYSCGVLSETSQFAAYKQSKVCVALKNFVNPSLDYEIPHNLYNMAKVNKNTVHNISEALDISSLFVDNPQEMLKTIGELVQSEENGGVDVKSVFFSCSEIMNHLGLDLQAKHYLGLDIDYRGSYK